MTRSSQGGSAPVLDPDGEVGAAFGVARPRPTGHRAVASSRAAAISAARNGMRNLTRAATDQTPGEHVLGKPGAAGVYACLLLFSADISGFALVSNTLIVLVFLVGIFGLVHLQHRYALYAFPYLIYILLFALAVGTLPTSASGAFTWLNGDGRAVTAFVPLILLGGTRVRWADLRVFVKFVQVVVWMNVAILVAAEGHVPGVHRKAIQKGVFFGFASSHHVAGYIASGAILILFGARRIEKLHYRPRVATIFAAAILLVASGSRTAMIGLIFVAIWTIFSKRRASDFFKSLLVTLFVAVVVILISSRISDTIASLFTPTFQSQANDLFHIGLTLSQSEHYSDILGSSAPQQVGFVSNILARFFYWGIAIGFILRSPFFGIGSFRYNDTNLGFSGIPHLADFATSGVPNGANVEGAHNQFLGALVENGIVGLFLLLMIWIVAYRRLRRSDKPAGLKLSGCQMVPFAFGTALTGYTLVAPSLTFIALTWLTLAVMVEDEPADVPETAAQATGGRTVAGGMAKSRSAVRAAGALAGGASRPRVDVRSLP
jgi:O-antigen ligase